MVKTRQPIPDLAFRPPAGVPPGVEVMTLAQLRTRVDDGHLGVARRPAFHHLITPTRGTLRHTVDFTDYTARPGGWLWIRPGQVQQWGDLRRTEATLVLFEPDFLDPATAAMAGLHDPHAPVLREPGPADRPVLTGAVEQLAATFAGSDGFPVDVHLTLLRHLLAVLVLRLAHLSGSSDRTTTGPGETFVRFRDAVERDFTRTRRLEDYGHALGYSARTLSRATSAAAGVNAKQFIDRRVILEARRLLAHTDQTAAQIAARLGFTSATNFTKYFQQRTATTPIAFRVSVRGDRGAGAAAGTGTRGAARTR